MEEGGGGKERPYDTYLSYRTLPISTYVEWVPCYPCMHATSDSGGETTSGVMPEWVSPAFPLFFTVHLFVDYS